MHSPTPCPVAWRCLRELPREVAAVADRARITDALDALVLLPPDDLTPHLSNVASRHVAVFRQQVANLQAALKTTKKHPDHPLLGLLRRGDAVADHTSAVFPWHADARAALASFANEVAPVATHRRVGKNRAAATLRTQRTDLEHALYSLRGLVLVGAFDGLASADPTFAPLHSSPGWLRLGGAALRAWLTLPRHEGWVLQHTGRVARQGAFFAGDTLNDVAWGKRSQTRTDVVRALSALSDLAVRDHSDAISWAVAGWIHGMCDVLQGLLAHDAATVTQAVGPSYCLLSYVREGLPPPVVPDVAPTPEPTPVSTPVAAPTERPAKAVATAPAVRRRRGTKHKTRGVARPETLAGPMAAPRTPTAADATRRWLAGGGGRAATARAVGVTLGFNVTAAFARTGEAGDILGQIRTRADADRFAALFTAGESDTAPPLRLSGWLAKQPTLAADAVAVWLAHYPPTRKHGSVRDGSGPPHLIVKHGDPTRLLVTADGLLTWMTRTWTHGSDARGTGYARGLAEAATSERQ